MSAERIAIVGMGGMLPGAADLAAFWRNVLAGVDAAREPPPHRWPLGSEAQSAHVESDHVLTTRGCFLDDVTCDPRGLSIDRRTLDALDPVYHLVLQAGRQAWEDGQTDGLDRARVGVALAAIALPTDGASAFTRAVLGRTLAERALAAERTADDGRADSNRVVDLPHPLNLHVVGMPAGLLARALDLRGGSFTLDAACASSLYALKLACDELLEGRADAMLAGGVSRPDCLFTQMGFSQLRALSPSGRCRPFDAAADGLLVGEGVGVVLLKRLSDALRSGDRVHAVIAGIGLANDVGGSLLAPDGEGQLRAMRAAYEQAGWAPQDVSLIECHGTGTPVGDTAEVQSLRRLWGEQGWKPGQCVIGSVKSNVGHLLTAAGIAGLLKTVSAISARQLPPTANFERANPALALATSPFRVLTHPAPWPERRDGRPRRAAVSAFGFGGINAHVLLEEPPAAARADRVERRVAPLQRSLPRPAQPPPVAIVGMAVTCGPIERLRAFQERLLRGEPAIGPRPADRWMGCDEVAGDLMRRLAHRRAGEGTPRSADVPGAYLDRLRFDARRFRLPPAEAPDLLMQQLLMLQVAADAVCDAGLSTREHRLRMGAVIGIAQDLVATDFHLRWVWPMLLDGQAGMADAASAAPVDSTADRWVTAFKDAASPPLTATRTMGALGSIVASRIAREFHLGGPSYTVSAEEASGLVALEIAVRSLQRGEQDAMLVGAVDLAGDVRRVLGDVGRRAISVDNAVRVFDASAGGSLPGDGAVALVLKRLSDAEADGDRIYAVIRGVGRAGGGDEQTIPAAGAYIEAVRRALTEAGIEAEDLQYVEASGSGDPHEDAAELAALAQAIGPRAEPCALGALSPLVGRLGAAAGLFSLAKAALCLFQEMLPPLPGCTVPVAELARLGDRFFVPTAAGYWFRDRVDGPRRAGVSAAAADGNCVHVVLEGLDRSAEACAVERRQPLGPRGAALFSVSADHVGGLVEGLDALRRFIESAQVSGRWTKPGAAALEAFARQWHERRAPAPSGRLAVAIVAADCRELERLLEQAAGSLRAAPAKQLDGRDGVFFAPHPLGPQAEVAFVFPGSGNHYPAMGNGLAAAWPEVLRGLDAESERLASQAMPRLLAPRRLDWSPGWADDAAARIAADPLAAIFGPVLHGVIGADLLALLGVRPRAVIGYSLGESAGLFALRAWRARDEMWRRLSKSSLFRDDLVGTCRAARQAWNLPPGEPVDWTVVVVRRGPREVRHVLARHARAHLLIVNTPEECVIGGQRADVDAAVAALGCKAVAVTGVPTVHGPVARGVEQAYRALHLFHVTPPSGVRFYSAAWGRAYELTRELAAASITEQAMAGFDFPAVIRQAWHDGVRAFIEIGPQSSCTRMIQVILRDKPCFARALASRGEPEESGVLKLLAALIAQRIPVDLHALYGTETRVVAHAAADSSAPAAPESLLIPLGRPIPAIRPRPVAPRIRRAPQAAPVPLVRAAPASTVNRTGATHPARHPAAAAAAHCATASGKALAEALVATAALEARAHEAFLSFSAAAIRDYERTLGLHRRLDGARRADAQRPGDSSPVLPRERCLQFARGRIADALGPAFAPVDSHPTRVRLPDEPLMLVDRVLALHGAARSLGGGRVITEHDVHPDAWYLDAGRAPVCISVEAGQADLLLSAWLGIDFATRGLRVYRLLDATVTFHRGLPRAGETIRYDIRIEKFVRQGETYLFFFQFDGAIGGRPLISMRDGCAGFFTASEIDASGGIAVPVDASTSGDSRQRPRAAAHGPRDADDQAPLRLVEVAAESLDDEQVDGLRRGDFAAAFGGAFAALPLNRPVRLPGGRMRLIDRVPKLDLCGGRHGRGCIRAEADIHPDDWFLTCHFVDDPVMPGTLMYECCAHALRVLLTAFGWVGEEGEVACEPVTGIAARLKCRGPVTPATRKVWYDVEIKRAGFNPAPFVVADALMYADGKCIVQFTDMSMQLTGLTRERLAALWSTSAAAGTPAIGSLPVVAAPKRPLFDTDRILAFAVGNPSEAFGEPYRPFDRERVIARLPGPPYQFLDRITEIHAAEPFVLKAGAWIEAQYDLRPDAWYFAAARRPAMPFSVLLEIALQPCGWLAAYLGSALHSADNLSFRNLGGNATVFDEIHAAPATLITRVRLTSVSQAGGMIIQEFGFQVFLAPPFTAPHKTTHEGMNAPLPNGRGPGLPGVPSTNASLQTSSPEARGASVAAVRPVYAGTTTFGFFSKAALAKQVGIRGAAKSVYSPTPDELARAESFDLPDLPPLMPSDAGAPPPAPVDPHLFKGGPGGVLQAAASHDTMPRDHANMAAELLATLPGRAYRMIDRIDLLIPDGGPRGLGFLRASAKVDPAAWFFAAHFYQDPVWPGSLGLEAFLQALAVLLLHRFGDRPACSGRPLRETHRVQPILTRRRHIWTYRGQVLPSNRRVEVDVIVTEVDSGECPALVARGFLRVDGIDIYEMTDFGVRAVPADKAGGAAPADR